MDVMYANGTIKEIVWISTLSFNFVARNTMQLAWQNNFVMRKKLVHLRQYLRLTGKSLRLHPTRIRHFWKRKCCCPGSCKGGRPKLLWRAVFRRMGFRLADETSSREKKKKVEREKERKKKKKTQGLVMTRPNRPTYPKKIFLTSVP